ncbi:hypothetical protein PISL3812_08243 [Talaromyces islandicus]|uniref:Uncharacterized protein n=1 Tax=Talaromyces islandicus TaxID=28573 RepID=A0A0U1M6H1_TALIS|nr:hypothetical protein PISL3812_08243 [Talaromyces islandicus]
MNSSTGNPPSSSTSRSKETAESLLQAFQNYNKRSSSATPRRPSMSPYPTTPSSQAETTRNNQTHQQQTTPKNSEASPGTRQSTPTPKAGKRQLLRTPFFEGSSSDEDEETLADGSGVKRLRSVTDNLTKEPDQSPVTKDPDSPLFVPRTGKTPPKPAQKNETAATKKPLLSQSVPKAIPQGTVPPKQPNPPTSSASAVQPSNRQGIVQRLSSESKRVANDLAQKNSTLLAGFPAGASSYFEAKLDEITKELVALHQQKVEAVKGEYIAKLQKEMSECQKMISMLQQNPEQES